jgi:hypothetical protein
VPYIENKGGISLNMPGVKAVFPNQELAVMEQAADKLGLQFKIATHAGQIFTSVDGYTYHLGHDESGILIETPGNANGLAEYWRVVRTLQKATKS